jgi:hypothetical protein
MRFKEFKKFKKLDCKQQFYRYYASAVYNLTPPNFRVDPEHVRVIDERRCRDCQFMRSFNLKWTCLKYLAYVRSDHTCEDWKDGRDTEYPVLNRYEIPSKKEEAFLRASEITDLRRPRTSP